MNHVIFAPASAGKIFNPMNIRLIKKHFAQFRVLAFLIAVVAFCHLANAQVTYTWNATNSVSVSTNWNANANWSDTGGTFPGSAASDIVIFTNLGVASASSTVNNVVSANTTIAFLTYGLTTTSGAFHNTQINPGVTLTVSSNVTIGTAGVTATTPVTMSGTGNFTTTGTGATLAVGGTGTPGTSQTATLTLANGNNNITMGTINVGNPNLGVNGSTCTLNLGTSVNNLYADNFNLGADKASGYIQWAAASAGSLNIANHTGTGRASITVGNPSSGTGTCKGGLLFAGGTGAGHPVSVLASTLTLGKMGSDTTTTVLAGTGTNSFDNGTFDVTTILIGVTATDEAHGAGLFGTITIGGNATSTATLIVNSPSGPGGGSFVIADATFATAGHTTASGILNINNNGIAQIYCPITKAGIANNTGTINITNGTLVMEAAADTIGTTAIPLDNLSLTSASLHLNVDATSTATNIVATNVMTSGTTTITIDSILNYTGGTTTNALISYTGTSPYTGLILAPLPSGYSGFISNDTARLTIDLVITSGLTVTLPVSLTWNGGSSTGNYWSDLNNWNGTNLIASDTLFFGGSARLNNTNDTTAGTTYSNLTFNAVAGAFVLNGNSIALATGGGNITNSSSNLQTVNLPLNFNSSLTIEGGSAGIVIGGGLTDTLSGNGVTTLTLSGTGTLTNLLASSTQAVGTNSISTTGTANWTLVDNASSSPSVVSNWGFNIVVGGTFNFGTAASAPILSTGVNGQNSDNTLGDSGTASTLNMVNGTLTIERRLNTVDGIINQSGGTLNVWNQLQAANSSSANVSAITVSGGTLNLWNSSGSSSGGGTLFLASRGTGTLTISGASTLVACATLDISRNAAGNTAGSVGTVNLNGGTLQVGNSIRTASNATQTGNPGTATFNFNGGTLKPNISSGTVIFQGSIVAPVIPIMAYVQAGGAIINTPNNKNLFVLESLFHDPALGVTPDGGLTKLGVGILTLASNATYTGNTIINAGTLQLSNAVTLANTPLISVTNGAVFDVSLLTSPFVLGSGQTLSNNASSTGTLGGNLNTGSGTVAVTYAAGTPSLNVTNGTLTLSASTTFNINNTGAALAAGSYKIISTNAGVAGLFAAVTGTLPAVTVSGGGSVSGTTNYLKLANSELYLVVNHPPVANPNNYTRNGLNAWRIAVSDLLANATDLDSDPLTLVGVGVSSNGITLVIGGGYVQYNNPSLVDDQFSYTVTDTFGGTSSAVITLTAGSATGVGGQINNFTANGGTASMTFAGIPGYKYNVQVSTNLTDWNTLWTTNAPAGGVFQFTDGSAPTPDAYYRLMWNGN